MASNLIVEYQEWGNKVQEEADQHNDNNTEYSTDTDLPPLVGRQRNNASSDNSMSKGSYDNHTDHDNSSIEGSDDERSTVLGLQQRNRVDRSNNNNSVQCPDQRAKECSDDSTSDGLYVYHTDNDDSSTDSSEDENSRTVSGS